MCRLRLDIQEWTTLNPENEPRLADRFLRTANARNIVSDLQRAGILSIIELKNGLSISTNSYVGSVEIDSLHIRVNSKLTGIPLMRLFQYAYGWRDLDIIGSADADTNACSFFDLLIAQLCSEVEELIHRGLYREYVLERADSHVMKGRVDFSRLGKTGIGTRTTLPCEFFQRKLDHRLNRVILAGLHLALRLVEDDGLALRLETICRSLRETKEVIDLNDRLIEQTIRSLNRLVDVCRPALDLIKLLYQGLGAELLGDRSPTIVKGYFFDMNRFFQRLVGTLLSEGLDSYIVQEEYTMHNVFSEDFSFQEQHKRPPALRPDFAIKKNATVIRLLDAKYRDIWENGLPREMLYQTSMYAMSGIGDHTATIIYPTVNRAARRRRININDPLKGNMHSQVILQPIDLGYLVNLLDDTRQLRSFVQTMVFGS